MPSVVRRTAVFAGLLALTMGAAAACGSSSSGGGGGGGSSVDVESFATQSAANLALSSGRVDVGMADSPVAAYQVAQSHGQFKLVGQAYGTAPYGIAVPKKSGTMDKAVLAALKALMANGTYGHILSHWGISSGGISNPVINGATVTSIPATPVATVTAPALDPAAAKLVPAAIKSKGSLLVAADASYAPNEFLASNGKTVVGMDADLAKALGTELGLKVTVQNITFDSIIPGLIDGRYALGMSSFTDTAAREKQVNFVTYFSAGTSFFVKANGGPNIQTLADLCGKKVAVESGTTEESDAKAQSAKCS